MPKIVMYNDGNKDRPALLLDKNEDGESKLFVLEGSAVSAPRRDKADYGDEGGGHTWHPAD